MKHLHMYVHTHVHAYKSIIKLYINKKYLKKLKIIIK